jgi:transcriptional regulator with XRE-family HTH domain
MILIRRLLGEVLRRKRQDEGRTLRQLAAEARISPGYLSEIERGQKEPSSELLAAICDALDIKLSDLLREVSVDMAAAELAARIEAERIGASITGTASVPQARVGATPVARTVARPGARPAPRPVTRRVPPPVATGSAPVPSAVLAQTVLDSTSRLGDAPTVPTKTAASRAAMGPMTPLGPVANVGMAGGHVLPGEGEIMFAFPLMNLGDLALR